MLKSWNSAFIIFIKKSSTGRYDSFLFSFAQLYNKLIFESDHLQDQNSLSKWIKILELKNSGFLPLVFVLYGLYRSCKIDVGKCKRVFVKME